MTRYPMRERLSRLINGVPPEAWACASGVIVFVAALWAQPHALVGSFYDDGVYVTLAKSLAEGRGYHNINLPGAPAGIHYPYLYPAVLSLLWRVWPAFPANVVLFQIFDAATLGAAAWLVARGSHRWPLGAPARHVALLAGFLAFPLLTMIGVRFSEPLLLVLLLGAVSLADDPASDLRSAVIAGALAGAAVAARSIGVAVIGGVVVGFWARGDRRGALVSLGVALAVAAPWFVWVATHAHEIDPRIASNYGTYFTEVKQAGPGALLPGLDLQAFRMQSPMARLAIPLLPLGLWYVVALLLMGFVIWGAVLVWPVAPGLMATLAGYTAIVTVWPYVPDRFMWIITPLAALCLATALSAAWRKGPLARTAAVVLALALLAGYARRQAVSLSGRVFAKTAEDASMALRWLAPAIESGTPPEAVIASEAEAGLYLYTGRHTVPSAPFHWRGRMVENLSPDSTVRFYCDAGVTHIALPAPEGGAAPVVAWLRARADSLAEPLFVMARGPALYRFRCPS